MRRRSRFLLSLGLAVGASLAQVLAPLLAAGSCARAAVSGSGRSRRARAVATSAVQQLRGQPTGPFLYWTFVALVPLIVGRQLPTVLDNQALNRRLAAMVGELEHQAFHDGLTNLPNRALFRERVAHALRRRSQAGTPLALLFIDLDDFKTVNDQLGHAAGDDLLVAVAGRLKTCIRGEDTVARLGGDEFAILLEAASSHEVAVRVAGRILEAMRAKRMTSAAPFSRSGVVSSSSP